LASVILPQSLGFVFRIYGYWPDTVLNSTEYEEVTQLPINPAPQWMVLDPTLNQVWMAPDKMIIGPDKKPLVES